jgi:bifunctional UDP-N-acetylglucosamine pyrophosphorylase/glucosamine-1-phosphate N-acetyltransferase
MKSRKAKVLHRAGGKTLIEHVVDTALQLAPPERIFVVVGHQADEVRNAVGHLRVGFVDQREQLGTGHAVLAGREQLEGLGNYLMVLYGDSPMLCASTLDRLAAQAEDRDVACVLMSAEMEDPTGYGRVIRDDRGRVEAVVEQKAGTPEQLAIREANMGIYCFRAPLFWEYAGEMRPDNPAREYYLTDMVEILNGAGQDVEAMLIDDAGEALGINTRIELAAADRLLRDRKVHELMLAGVTIEKPETVTVDPTVCVGMDTIIEPFAQILGKSTIGENCRIGASAVIRDSHLGDEVEIEPLTVVLQSRVDNRVRIGPFARLRPDNHVEAGCHIGNFVELKKTRLGAGSKANHLAYLGDTTIGSKVNIGAGTITCNYDGQAKHPTKIGDGSFVGTNSTLVAPLEIGEGAYIAAGSVITDPVPADALAVGRGRQVNKEDWAKKRRERSGRH